MKLVFWHFVSLVAHRFGRVEFRIFVLFSSGRRSLKKLKQKFNTSKSMCYQEHHENNLSLKLQLFKKKYQLIVRNNLSNDNIVILLSFADLPTFVETLKVPGAMICLMDPVVGA